MLYQSILLCANKESLLLDWLFNGTPTALIEKSLPNNVAILGDFNAGIDTQFDTELQELCSNLDLVVSDCDFYGRTSGMFTHVSNAQFCSWLNLMARPCNMQLRYAS